MTYLPRKSRATPLALAALALAAPAALVLVAPAAPGSAGNGAAPAVRRVRGRARAKGQRLSPASTIGAATGLELLGGGRVQAVAEPPRVHGGRALVVRPAP